MPKPRSRIRVALIQVRDHEPAAEQERLCFLRRCRLDEGQLRVHNLVHEPFLDWDDVADADAVMIGGAGGHSATQVYPFTAPLIEVVGRLLEEDRPFFGSCWGHQFLAQVLGGTVIEDTEAAEVGTFDVEVTPAGHRDPLLARLPPRFAVQLGHNDRIFEEPRGIEVLASSERCAHQIIRVVGKPAYGSQFHSEMNDDDMRLRVHMYRDVYIGRGEEAVAAFSRRLRPSPEADRLLDLFLQLYT